MKKLLSMVLILFSAVFLAYLLLPNPEFPVPPPNSLQSSEPADTESTLRRAYFTDYSREETMNWYKSQMDKSAFYNITLPTFRLNYPPEDSATIIRDQTRSTFLEEIVHPFRESLYINGFEPKNDKDAVIIEGRLFRQKIIVKQVSSAVPVRIAVFVGIVISLIVLFTGWKKVLGDIIQIWRKKN